MSQEKIKEIKAAVPRMRAICAGERDQQSQEDREFMLHISSLLDGRSGDWSWWYPIRNLYHEALRITYNAEQKREQSRAESEIREWLSEARPGVRERPHKTRGSANEYIRFLIRSLSRTRRILSIESGISELKESLIMIRSQLEEETIDRAVRSLAKATIRARKGREAMKWP